MNVHLFGKVDSSCCFIWGLNKAATDNITNVTTQVKDAILDNFYMDDYLDSFDTKEKAIETSESIITTLKMGGFCLTKWISNNQEILSALPSAELSPSSINLVIEDTGIERALGILWNPCKDSLQIKVSKREVPLTKRGILSYTSSIFDPFGILTPVILEPKVIIQSLWKENLD